MKNITTFITFRGILAMGLILTGLSFAGCRHLTEDVPRANYLVRVYDRYLYPQNIPDIVLPGTSATDSALIVNKFIDNWINKQLMLIAAEDNISAENLDREIQFYKETILRSRYEQAIIASQLDTLVSDAEIEKYYKDNSESFTLGRDVMEIAFLPVTYFEDQAVREIKNLEVQNGKTWEESVGKIIEKYDYNLGVNARSWQDIESFSNKYSLSDQTMQNIRRRNFQTFEFKNPDGTYIAKVFNVRLKGENSPLEYSKDKIRSIVLNHRKTRIITEIEKNLKDDALDQGKIQIREETKE